MSDQNVITDWRAYFASLGPGKPTTPEQLEAMRDKDPRMVLLCDDNVGSLMSRFALEDADCLDEALAIWLKLNRPRAWLQLGQGTAPWFVDAEVSSLPKRKGVRSSS